MAQKRKLSQIVYREDLDPRMERDPALVQQYAEVLELLPPIEINQKNELIDGRHRYLAYKSKKQTEIPVKITKTETDEDVALLAAQRNATSGSQLSTKEKAKCARMFYQNKWGGTQKALAEMLAVSIGAMNGWVRDIEKQRERERLAFIFSLWLACHTEHEIVAKLAERAKIDQFYQLKQPQVHGLIEDASNGSNLKKLIKVLNFRQFEQDDRWRPQIYSKWEFSELTNNVRVFGSIPQEILDNLLYYYTAPFDVVFDPFAGGGMTIDVCRKRLRRYYVSDLTPIEARQETIRKHDITTGLPKFPAVPHFVFLDPPYWKQAKGQYSNKKTDLGNVGLESFLGTIGNIAQQMKTKWTRSKRGGRLALIIGPQKEGGKYVDLAFLCYERIKKYLTPMHRIIVPYSTQVHGGAYVQKAKDNKEILYLTRDLMIFGYGNKI